MKLLVPNADDFGLDPAINTAIAQTHTAGILTSASLLIGAAHTDPAIEFARDNPALGVGVHLCLVDGQPVASPDKVAGLIGRTGTLPPNPLALSALLALGRGVELAVEVELRAQIEKFLATGLRPTHLDTHQHTHLLPSVQRIMARLAREYDIAWVRGPVEPLRLSLRCDCHHKTRTLARWSVFGTLGARCARRLRQFGLRTTNRSVGVLNAGQLTEEFLLAYLPLLPDGVAEFVFHPATEPLESGYQQTGELQALCSPRVRELLERSAIQLVNFQELAMMREL